MNSKDEEELAELIANRACHIQFWPVKEDASPLAINNYDVYVVSLYNWNIQEFGTAEGAEKFRQTLKAEAKKQILLTLFNKRLSDKMKEEHENKETTIAVKRQKALMDLKKTSFDEIKEDVKNSGIMDTLKTTGKDK